MWQGNNTEPPFDDLEFLDNSPGTAMLTGVHNMINLVIWSFALILIPLAAGIAWKITAALARSIATAFGVVEGRAGREHGVQPQPHRYADHAAARSWLSSQGWGHRETVSDKDTFKFAGAMQARSLQA
jgi:hypothetical protein